jgi:hypothetical protein
MRFIVCSSQDGAAECVGQCIGHAQSVPDFYIRPDAAVVVAPRIDINPRVSDMMAIRDPDRHSAISAGIDVRKRRVRPAGQC